MDFTEFDLHPDVLDGIDALHYKTATPIQERAIPIIFEGKDLIGIAQTGTGKTAAFILPILSLILDSGESNYTQALVIVPTRELAMQIDQVIEACSYYTGVSSMAIYGGGDGKSFSQEKSALTSGADIIIATPGRLIAHMNMGYVDFSRLRFLVLDEADRMLDMGFKPDLMKIIDRLNKDRQTILFSATMPKDVMRFAKTLLVNPETVSIAVSKPAEGVSQGVYMVGAQQKLALVASILKDLPGARVIVFGSTKQSVNALYQKLATRQFPVGQISSDVEQTKREQVMLDYRNRKIDILIATDVLSRGIDVDGIEVVINYDVPRDPEDYVHRVGRTARAARTGQAITLVEPSDQHRFTRIERFIGTEIERLRLPAHLGDQRPERKEQAPKKDGKPKQKEKKPQANANNNKEKTVKEAAAPQATAPAATENAPKKKARRRRRPNKNKQQGAKGGQIDPVAS